MSIQTIQTIQTSVSGGYNGGAIITIKLDNNTVFSAVGTIPYNLQYNPDSGSFNTDLGVVNISVSIASQSSNLIITFSGAIEETLSVPHLGNNTSYGYNYTNSFSIEIPEDIYTIVFNSNGGTGSMASQDVEIDEFAYLNLNTFVKEDFIFIGWSLTPNGSVEYNDGAEIYNIAEAFTTKILYAVWEAERLRVDFSYNKSDERQIYKQLQRGETFNGTLRDSSSIINPVIMFESPEVMRFNFCYIPAFKRYYFVREIESFRNNLWIVTMECDVLMSFKNDIANCQVVVDKQTMSENGDEYIDDGSLVCDNYMFNRIYNFDAGFNDSPTYILICAG